MKNKEDWVTGNVTIKIGGHPLSMQMTVPVRPVKIRYMLPIFHQMSNSFVDLGVDAAVAAGGTVSCKAGCGMCCRQPVPIAEAEAYQIHEMVENMLEPRRSEIKKRFDDACEHFTKTGWFKKIDKAVGLEPDERNKLIEDYFREDIPCPFLVNESCSIHKNRPLSCREYLVTSPAKCCADPAAGNIQMVNLPVKPWKTFCALTKSKNLNPAVNFVPLILSLVWVKLHDENEDEKPGEEWMADFFRELSHGEIPGKDN